jgi:hypothetical protein
MASKMDDTVCILWLVSVDSIQNGWSDWKS